MDERGTIVTTDTTNSDIKPKAGSARLAELLAEMNQEGGFSISILTDRQGFPIASAAQPGEDPDVQAAVVALVQKTAVQARQQLGMAQTDEISLYDAEGQRLVCRPFDANGYDMILAVRIPHRNQSYRRLTNLTISTVRRIWKL
jgi:predicted regulator of Ras-like GTPase activity (Roadblock/LC7/MglB family)